MCPMFRSANVLPDSVRSVIIVAARAAQRRIIRFWFAALEEP